jgi:hypothetical protein
MLIKPFISEKCVDKLISISFIKQIIKKVDKSA